MEDPSYFKQPWYLHPIPRSLNALALLASGGPDYLPLIRKEAEWAAKTSGMGSWNCAYVLLFLSEYKIATGDESVMAGLTRIALEAAHGQSAVGSWGHRIDARFDGRL